MRSIFEVVGFFTMVLGLATGIAKLWLMGLQTSDGPPKPAPKLGDGHMFICVMISFAIVVLVWVLVEVLNGR
jgi:hypothetical protein